MKQERTQVRRPSATSYKAVDVEEGGSTFVDVGYVNAAAVGTGKGAAGVPDFAGAFNAAVSTAGTMYKIYKKGKKGEEDAQAHEGTVQGQLEAHEDQAALIEEGTKPDQLVEQRSWQYQNAIVKSKDMPEPERAAFMGAYGKAQLGFQYTTDSNIVAEAQDEARANIGNWATVAMRQTGEIPTQTIYEQTSNIAGLTKERSYDMASTIVTAQVSDLAQNYDPMTQAYQKEAATLSKNIGMYTEGVDRVAMDLAGFIPSDTKAYKEEFNQLHPTEQKQLTQEARQEYINRRLNASQIQNPHDILTKLVSGLKGQRDPNGIRLLDTTKGKALKENIAGMYQNIQINSAVNSDKPVTQAWLKTLTPQQRVAFIEAMSSSLINAYAEDAQHNNGASDGQVARLEALPATDQKIAGDHIRAQLTSSFQNVLNLQDVGKLEEALHGTSSLLARMNKNPILFKAMEGTQVARMSMLYKVGVRGQNLILVDEALNSISLKAHQATQKPHEVLKEKRNTLHALRDKGVITSNEQAEKFVDMFRKIEIYERESGRDLNIDVDTLASSFVFTGAASENGFEVRMPTGGIAGRMEATNAGSVGASLNSYLSNNMEAYDHLVEGGFLEDGAPLSELDGTVSLIEAPDGGGYMIHIRQDNIGSKDEYTTIRITPKELKGSWIKLQRQHIESGAAFMTKKEAHAANINQTSFSAL
jgi:hypothetical protein